MHWSKSVHINFSVAKSVPDFSFSPWMQMWSITVKKWNTSRRKSAMTFSKVWFHFKTNLESWVKGVRKQVDSQACSRFNIRVHTYYNRKATGDQVFQLFLFYTCWAMWLNRSSLTDLRDPEIQNCKLFKFPFGCRVWVSGWNTEALQRCSFVFEVSVGKWGYFSSGQRVQRAGCCRTAGGGGERLVKQEI